MYVSRILDLKKTLNEKSCFLFGPRQTGKTSLIENNFPESIKIDLLDSDIFLRLNRAPKDLTTYITNPKALVVLDEIQRIPDLLNEVHRLIEKQNIRFLLTGSSARKLRKAGVNLLGGRARSRVLHPFVYMEIKESFVLNKALLYGNIPSILLSREPVDDLKSYVGEYLKEEIVSEAATRNIPAFSRFLEAAAVTNGQMINYEKIGNDAQVARSTLQSYYQILRDTLIGRDLEAFRKTKTRKAIGTSKFFFFDLGIVNFLKGNKAVTENSTDFGNLFEAYFHHELSSFCDYFPENQLNYWRSQSGMEVDFLLNEEIAIEIKSTKFLDRNDFKGLNALSEEFKLKKQIVVCRETVARKIGDIEVLPWQIFLEKIWMQKY